ncbi:barwin-like endoglucanase [Ceratobasidium sp. AG-I]|nr:barwin-like endoglucanase [Ceratobasidium sp. AG-I]
MFSQERASEVYINDQESRRTPHCSPPTSHLPTFQTPNSQTQTQTYTMHFITKIYIALSALSLAASAVAAPISVRASSDELELSARGGNGARHGWATYYSPSEGRGACGWNNKDSEHVVAISKSLWDETSHGGTSSECGKTAAVTWHGKTVNVRVVDLCPVCGHDDIDLSPSAFEKLADKDVGKLEGVSWKFV